MAVDLSKPTCNVFRQAEFQRSNNILDGVLKQAKASGEERAVEHKEAITADDLEKIQCYFDDVLDVGDPCSEVDSVLLVSSVDSFCFA